jgi:hypothetical protein
MQIKNEKLALMNEVMNQNGMVKSAQKLSEKDDDK